MQSSNTKLDFTEKPKYYLLIHPIFAFTGITLLALILLFIWLLFFPKLIEPFIYLPVIPWFLIVIAILGCILTVWFIALLVLSLTSLKQHRTKGRKPDELQKRSVLNSIVDIVVLILVVSSEQIYHKMVDIFPQYSSLWQFLFFGIGLSMMTWIIGYFILRMTPRKLRKELSDKEII